MKFVHCADIHLDSPLRGLEAYEGAPAAEIRLAARKALTNLVDLAIAEEVPFVLIAGDLYDGDWRDFNTGLFFARQMVRLKDAGIKALIVRGNHDAMSQITRNLRMPDNVNVFPSDHAATVRLDDLGIAVHGRSFQKPAVFDDLAETYPAPVRGLINIGILHTALSGHSDHERYAPCEAAQLAATGYDYWALGHIHQSRVVMERPWIVFPGNIQGRHMKETGPKGCVLVDVEGGSIQSVEHRSLDVIRFARVGVDVGGARNIDDAVERTMERLADAVAHSEGRMLCARIELTGACAAYPVLLSKRTALLHQLRAAAFEIGNEALWIERVDADLGMEPSSSRECGPAISEIHTLIGELKSSPEAMESLKSSLDPLLRRLPADLREQIVVDELTNSARLVDQVERLLVARLIEQEERA